VAKTVEFVSVDPLPSAELSRVLDRGKAALADFDAGVLQGDWDEVRLTFASAGLPPLAPAPAIERVGPFSFGGCLGPVDHATLTRVIGTAQGHFGRVMRLTLSCHQPETVGKRLDTQTASFRWDRDGAWLAYFPDDIWRFPLTDAERGNDQSEPKQWAAVFEQMIKACDAPVKVVKDERSFDFAPKGKVHCQHTSASWNDGGYGGPHNLHWQSRKQPAEQAELLERILTTNGNTRPRVWTLEAGEQQSPHAADFRGLYERVRAEDWPLTACQWQVRVRPGGVEHLDALLPFLAGQRKPHRHKPGGFTLPARDGARPRWAGLAVLSSAEGHRIAVKLPAGAVDVPGGVETALGIRFRGSDAAGRRDG
jgi:hypothetical protein